jgi:glycosyltransferase involved in cell wall biosynthesis
MTASGPRVSIGLPVYNGEAFLAEAIESLLAQTYRDIEVIICDNASTDQTGPIARAYAARDARVRYVRNERNVGLARNYQRALALARGEFFRWAAADDVSAPAAIERCVEALARDPSIVLAYPKTRLIDEHGKPQSDYEDGLHLMSPQPIDRFRIALEQNTLCNVIFGLMPVNVARRVRPLGVYVGSDFVFLAELSLYGGFWEVPESLLYRRFYPGASGTKPQSELEIFFNPITPRRLILREWRHLWELVLGTVRAPISVGERARVLGYLGRRAIGLRDKLGREIALAARYAISGMRRVLRD